MINYYHYLIVGCVSSLNEKNYDNFSMQVPSAGLCQELCIEKLVNITMFIVQVHVFISSRTYFSVFKCCIIINVSSNRKWYFSASEIIRWDQLHYITVDSLIHVRSNKFCVIRHLNRIGHAFVQQTTLWIYISIPITANLTVLMIWTQRIATRVTHAGTLRDLQPTILFFYLVSFDKK